MGLGALLETCRRADGLSRAELARRSGVSQDTAARCASTRGQIATYLTMVEALGRCLVWGDLEGEPGASLGAQRRLQGISQRQAAYKLGITQPTVVALERRFRGRVETLDGYLRLLRLKPRLVRPGEPGNRPMVPRRNAANRDLVYTPRALARHIIDHFPLHGRVLDPCKGTGAFYDELPDCVDKHWSEITEGRDFFAWLSHVDWVIGNPPWSDYRRFLNHAMKIADDVVLLSPINNISTTRRIRDIQDAGFGVKELFGVPVPASWPQFGFAIAALHLRRGWTGNCAWTGTVGFSNPVEPM